MSQQEQPLEIKNWFWKQKRQTWQQKKINPYFDSNYLNVSGKSQSIEKGKHVGCFTCSTTYTQQALNKLYRIFLLKLLTDVTRHLHTKWDYIIIIFHSSQCSCLSHHNLFFFFSLSVVEFILYFAYITFGLKMSKEKD